MKLEKVDSLKVKLFILLFRSLIVFVIAFFVSGEFELFERLSHFVATHEAFEIDEIFFAVLMVILWLFSELLFLIRYVYKKAITYEEMSFKDELTSVLNRRGFFLMVEDRLEKLKRQGRSAQLLYLDINDFKLINDNYGHVVGDEVLVKIGSLFTDFVECEYLVGRIGGDEFVVLIMEESQAVCGECKEQITERLAQASQDLSVDLEVSISVGTANFPSDGLDIDTLLHAADSHMYEVKASKKMKKPN